MNLDCLFLDLFYIEKYKVHLIQVTDFWPLCYSWYKAQLDLVVANISPFTLSLSKKKKKRVVLNVIQKFSGISLEIKSLINIGTDW